MTGAGVGETGSAESTGIRDTFRASVVECADFELRGAHGNANATSAPQTAPPRDDQRQETGERGVHLT